MLGYYRTVVRRALRDTVEGANRQGIGVGLAIAIATAVVAGSVSQELGERFNVGVAIYSAVLAAAALIVLFFLFNVIRAPYRLHQEVERDRDALQRAGEPRRIREALGVFLGESQALQSRCEIESIPPPEAEFAEWARRVETFLAENLDTSYIARFRNSAGLPPAGITVIASYPHRTLWLEIRVRRMRLDQFITETR